MARLHEELNNEAVRAEAAEILRGLIHEIRLIPEADQLEIELIGELAAMASLSEDTLRPAEKVKITMVAEALNHRQHTVCVEA